MLGLWEKDAEQKTAKTKQRKADQALLARRPALEKERDDMTAKIAALTEKIEAGTLTTAALAKPQEALNYAVRLLQNMRPATSRLIDGCPDEKLQDEARRLRGRKLVNCDRRKEINREVETLMRTQVRLHEHEEGELAAMQSHGIKRPTPELSRTREEMAKTAKSLGDCELSLAEVTERETQDTAALANIYARMIQA